MQMKSVLALVLALFSMAAAAASNYYVHADIVRGRAGAQGAICVANSVFFPGESIVWRALVFDAASQTALSEEQVKKLGVRVTIALDNGASLNMKLGLHPPNPKAPRQDRFWSVSYPIEMNAPLGTIRWTMTATDSDGNTGSYAPIGQDAGINLLTIAKPPVAAPRTASVDGQGLYGQHCASCHQAGGQGVPGVFPSLVGSSVVTGERAYLAQLILSGLEGKVTIKGQSYDGNMPGMGGVLNDTQVATILTYIRASWNNGAAPVGEDVVKAERAKAGSARENHARYPK